MIQILLFALALLAGAATALQIGVNSQLRVGLGNPFQAGLVSFAVGTIALAIIALPQGLQWNFAQTMSLPWWVWTGGLLGAYFVTALIILAPRLGASTLIGLALTGQLLVSLVLDHYGLLGFPVQRLSLPRMLGAALLIAGVVLIRRF
ncbi:MAG: DMT family transporter [Pyrinomonadaceae bacterium]